MAFFAFRFTATMTDPFSLSSGVVGFAAFVLQVATTVHDFVRDAKNLPKEFTKLASDTKEFASLVERLKPAIDIVEARYVGQPDGMDPSDSSPMHG